MLKFLLPLTLLFIKNWSYFLISTISLSFMFLPLLYFSINMKSFSTMFILDPMSSPLIMLTLWTSAMMLLSSYVLMKKKAMTKEFSSTIMFLLMILMLSFSTSKLIMFYILFEASLIPTLILILVWGYQPERLQAGMYLMLYTVTASLPLLSSILLTSTKSGSSFMFFFTSTSFSSLLIPVSLSLAFLVKMPMYITHLWLPKAHVEAPVAGSMILAGILLKLGSYGLLRTSMMMPQLIKPLSNMTSSISMVGASMTAIICIRQQDIKSLIAYSSVGHMALLIAGFFSFSKWGWEGSIVMMIAHGLSSSCLFALANMYYETTSSRALLMTKGMLILFPTMTMWWFLMSAANMAAPPTLNLLAEILLLTSIMFNSWMFIPLMMFSGFLAAAYSLFLFTSTHHGSMNSSTNNLILPLSRNSIISLLHTIPLFFFILSSSNLSMSF